jgi:sugar lactone lactonase YvrE
VAHESDREEALMRWLIVTAAAAALFSTLAGSAAAARTVVSFDPASGEFPEGIAFGRDGAMYVSLAPLGEIRRFDADGSSRFFSFDPGSTGLGILGLASGKTGVLYAAVPSDAPAAHGVWALAPDGTAKRFLGSDQIVFPNAITLDHRGTLYVTDSILGAIWRITGDETELWLQHESLEGLAVLNPFALGANGIAYRDGRLLVANTEKKHLVEVPVQQSGAPGVPRIIHSFLGPADFLDGIAVDVAGNSYVCVAGRNELVRISRAGDEQTVATAADGLSLPVSLAFGPRGEARRALYITSLSLPPFAPMPMPSVVAVGVPLPGPPLR